MWRSGFESLWENQMDHRKSAKKKRHQLGMAFGTAMSRLRKKILFSLVQKCREDVCFRCSLRIESVDQFSIEHKQSWLDVDAKLFWDMDNIAFSHITCNVKAARKTRKWKSAPEKWHGQYLYRKNDPKRYLRILMMKRRRYHSRYSSSAKAKMAENQS